MAIATGATKLLQLAAATTTALMTSGDWELPWGAKGAIFVVDITASSGITSGVVFQIQMKDEVSGKYIQLNANPTAITANGTYTYVVFPGAGTTPGTGSGITAVTDTTFIPPKGRVLLNRTDGTYTGTVSMTPYIE